MITLNGLSGMRIERRTKNFLRTRAPGMRLGSLFRPITSGFGI